MSTPGERAPRPWGYWTEVKLQILSDYLDAFLTACQSQREVIYLDAFAGDGHGLSRVTGQVFEGSALRALNARGRNGNGFTRLRYFERESKAAQLEARLRAGYPGRDIRVYGGDCNTRLHDALDDLRDVSWAPTFAFVDPDGLEVDWQTLEMLAAHKRGSKYKTELWLLFASPALMRVLGLRTPITADAASQITRLFGTTGWQPIHDLRRTGQVSAEEARNEFVNLMRWRLENDLGYVRTHALHLKSDRGVPLYHMIFATDNPAGDRIMSAIYAAAARGIPDMAREAREHRPGAQLSLGLESDEPISYVYEPPRHPPPPDDPDVISRRI
ncbi:MAG TPA: three-Cys-motif partner protein TcmP [Solirubrobacteraceae bacterium]|jgi:three-Cys-motif partner protein